MFVKSKLADFFIRSVVGVILGLLFGILLSEFSYRFLDNKETLAREPSRVDLIIPYGTARQVEDGIYNQSIPTNLVFVEGDMLVVRNEDVVAHQIGPLWVPSGTSSILVLDQADRLTYECSFQPTKYMGLDVRPRVTGDTRLQAVLAIALPTGMMLAVYSYLIPTRSKLLKPASRG